MSAQEQIEKLANFIMAEIDGEPSESEGAGDTAIRIIRNLKTRAENCEHNFKVQVDETKALESEVALMKDVVKAAEKLQDSMDKSFGIGFFHLREALRIALHAAQEKKGSTNNPKGGDTECAFVMVLWS